MQVKKEDTLVLVGDLVGKGPKSHQVIQRLMQIQKEGVCNLQCVMGNHDQKATHVWNLIKQG